MASSDIKRPSNDKVLADLTDDELVSHLGLKQERPGRKARQNSLGMAPANRVVSAIQGIAAALFMGIVVTAILNWEFANMLFDILLPWRWVKPD